MGIGIAHDQHLLSLDDHPRRFLPWFHMADPRADAEVTLRDMLSHRTGLKAKADLAATPGVEVEQARFGVVIEDGAFAAASTSPTPP